MIHLLLLHTQHTGLFNSYINNKTAQLPLRKNDIYVWALVSSYSVQDSDDLRRFEKRHIWFWIKVISAQFLKFRFTHKQSSPLQMYLYLYFFFLPPPRFLTTAVVSLFKVWCSSIKPIQSRNRTFSSSKISPWWAIRQ